MKKKKMIMNGKRPEKKKIKGEDTSAFGIKANIDVERKGN